MTMVGVATSTRPSRLAQLQRKWRAREWVSAADYLALAEVARVQKYGPPDKDVESVFRETLSSSTGRPSKIVKEG
jgi:hypothetical protein